MPFAQPTRLVVIGALAALFSSYAVGAVTCGPGTYRQSGVCHWCQPGTWSNANQFNVPSSCTNSGTGKIACGPKTGPDGGDGDGCYGATGTTNCGTGYYQPNQKGSECIICPRGSECSSTTTANPTKCNAGEYAKEPGTANCSPCPRGSFNNIRGAFDCCKCCAGWYTSSSGTGAQGCTSCPTTGVNPRRYSLPGSNSNSDCQSASIPDAPRANTCTPPSSNAAPGTAFCPPELGGGNPGPSPINKRRATHKCAPGYKSCPRLYGQGGFDCVDIRNDSESCGGCVDPFAPEGTSSGKDCTAIPNVNITRCVRSKCIIDSCRKGFTKSFDGTTCVEVAAHLTNQSAKKRQQKWNRRGLSHSSL